MFLTLLAQGSPISIPPSNSVGGSPNSDPAAGIIRNPAINSLWGTGGNANSASIIASLIATFIRTMVIIAGLGFILYFILGAVEWITSGGDKGKVEEAKNRIMSAATGLAIMLALFAVSVFLKSVLGIDLLNIVWPTPS